jgi:hypothetical protein
LLLLLQNSILGAYLVFAIADSIFHFTGDKTYISMLKDALTGLGIGPEAGGAGAGVDIDVGGLVE